VDDELLRALTRHHKRDTTPETAMETTATTRDVQSEISRPFQGDERAALLDALFSKIDASASETPTVTSIRSKRRVGAIVAAVTAIAAALVLWIALPRAPQVELPTYALTELHGGAAAMRSDPSQLDRVVELAPEDRLSLMITPATANRVPLVVDVVIAAPGAAPRMVRVPAEVSPSGAVRLTTTPTSLGLDVGEHRLVVAISSADAPPDDPAEALSGPERRRIDVRVRVASSR
jgi:hypothetical protein